MIKMVLADDEPVITRGIQKLVDWKELGIEIVGEFTDGKSAMDGILTKKPEIALLDISMPGMTGVEILKECQSMEVKTQIVFISGFQDFEYAQAALRYGAKGYLLKPIIREELLNAMEKCLLEITKKGSGLVPVMEDTLEETQADYGRLVAMEDTNYIPVLADVVYRPEENRQMRKLVQFSLISFLEEYLEENKKGISFVKKGHIVVVFKGLDRIHVKKEITALWQNAREAAGHQVFFVIGESVPNMGGIPPEFDRCVEMEGYLFFADEMQMPVLTVGEAVYGKRIDADALSEERGKILDAIIALDSDGFERHFDDFTKLLLLAADGKKEDACFYFCSAIRLVEERFTALGLQSKNADIKSLLEQGRNCTCFGEMVHLYHGTLREYFPVLKESIVNSEKRDILLAKEYIENHYNENLTLNILAEEIHMNSYYFSAFFKKNAGENFKDYVNGVRIRHAVFLLVSTDKKVYEIADEVGFADVRSFSEVFRRFYDETPNSYRKRVLSTGNKNTAYTIPKAD